ncbi:hypothetical protein [Spirosoma areae]
MPNQPAYYSVQRIRFEFRKQRTKKPVPGIVYALIYVVGQDPEPRSTGIRATREDWDNRTARGQSLSAKDLNEKLVLWERSAHSAARTINDRGDVVTPGGIVEEMTYATRPLLALSDVVDKFLAYKKTTVGPDKAELRKPGQICYGTYHSYHRRRLWLSRFLKARQTPNLVIRKVDSQFIQAFTNFLSQQPTLGAAYAAKCVKLLTEVCNWATLSGLIDPLAVGHYRATTLAEKPPHNVTEEEVLRIEALELPTQLGRVRDGWLLARELCLHYSDYLQVKKEHFSWGKHGHLIFEKARQKQESARGIKLLSLVSERALRIWNQYGQKLPIRASNVHLGRLIAEIGQEAELEQRLTFSHARDSGIFSYVAAGCRDAQIRLAAGWTSTKQLSRYVNHDRRLLEEILSPTNSPATGGNSGGTPERSQPFLQIYKAS